ncbi:MAG: hypothetical protein RIC19_11195 [Phaeodactylibacter sp.]|uniref:hypothetical protein n=1 Tax=Phaeodactylibacter sp. TaxID=1940289 RepID=UPI0032EE0DD7
MRNVINFAQLFVLVVVVSSCSVSRYTAPPFTNVSGLLELNQGMDLSEVSNILKIPPYDIIHQFSPGDFVVVYNYRVLDRNLRLPTRAAQNVIHGEEGQKGGDDWYNTRYLEAYLLFKGNKLEGVYSQRSFDEGVRIEYMHGVLSGQDSLIAMRTDDKGAVYGGLPFIMKDNPSALQEAQLRADEEVEKRRNLLKTAGIVLLGLLGLTLLGG